MKIKMFTALAISVAMVVPVSAANWQPAVSGNSDQASIDEDSIRSLPPIPYTRPFPVQQMWQKWTYGKDHFWHTRKGVVLVRYDCAAETSANISSTLYDASDKYISSDSWRDAASNYVPVTPGTLGWALMEIACGRRPLPSER